MNPVKKITAIVGGALVALLLIAVLAMSNGLLEKNNNQNYQVNQSLSGEMSVRNEGGWYLKKFATVTTMPKSQQAFFSQDTKEGGAEDDSIRATFNDGGIAKVSTIVRFRMPISEEQRLLVHREFEANMSIVEASVRAHLVNCIKATATMMTASENQTSRKAEFAKVIGDQLQEGLYAFRRVEVEVLDVNGQPKTTEDGKKITTFATEIVESKPGIPTIDEVSPLKQYGIEVTQFSVTSVEYDDATREQFAKKKDASLKAELAKIQVEQAKQETIAVQEEGKRLVATKEAEMNVEIAEAEGIAAMAVATAEQQKLQAGFVKETAEIAANQALEVAKLNKMAAEEEAQTIVLLAEAEQQKIELAGYITETDRVLAEIAAKRDAMVFEAMSKMQMPNIVNIGGAGAGGSGGGDLSMMMEALGLNAMIDLNTKMGSSVPAAE